MAKGKSISGMKNKHLHARISFLHQAATYLTGHQELFTQANQTQADGSEGKEPINRPATDTAAQGTPNASRSSSSKHNVISVEKPSSGGLPLYLSSHLNQVARKSQIRLAPEVKHSICKRCGTIQVEGETCKKSTENLSEARKKPHADVLVRECRVCGAKKRWPVGARRQRKKGERKKSKVDEKDLVQADPGAMNLTQSNAEPG
jgi:ribonuclease P protein subunit RPR2